MLFIWKMISQVKKTVIALIYSNTLIKIEVSCTKIFPTIKKAPNKPKIAPDAPTDAWFETFKNTEASEPVKSEMVKINKNLFLP